MKTRLDSILDRWSLLKHPFYRAWTAGTLPMEALKLYASEYGAFISILPEGWRRLKDAETAAEEQEHAEMWRHFAAALGAKIKAPKIPQTKALIENAHRLFTGRASTLGAMYAFEAQQPETAQSKLFGLKMHYSLPSSVEPYFEVHATNWHESQKILREISALSTEEQAHALAACEKMSESLWNALTGIQEKACIN